MIITVLSGGSRGDVQPYVALAKGFKAAGHTVRLATLPEFAPMLEGTGIDSLVLDIDVRKMLDSEDGRQMVGAGGNHVLFLRKLSRFLRPLMEQSVQEVARLCKDSDGLVLSSMSIVAGTRGLERDRGRGYVHRQTRHRDRRRIQHRVPSVRKPPDRLEPIAL